MHDFDEFELPASAHVIVLHRRADRLARYAEYLDHSVHRVTYVATEKSRVSVPEGAARTVLVADLTSWEEVRAAVAAPVAEFGAPAAVVAFIEAELAVAARLREEFGSRGRLPQDLVPFLDKHAMLVSAAATGARTPRFTLVTSAEEVRAFADEVGWPVVVKPLEGRAGRGIHRLDDASWLDAVTITAQNPLLAQEYLPHSVYHVDGVFDGTRMGPWRLSRYVNMPSAVTTGPLAFNYGQPLGAVEVDDPEQLKAVAAFLDTLIPRMSPQPWVFHLELFLHLDGKGWQCTFLEVGCRPGGGPIPRTWNDVHGVDLYAWEFPVQCGLRPRVADLPPPGVIGGSLYVPVPGTRPCRVLRADSMTGTENGPFAEHVPAVGAVMPATKTAREFFGGNFWFRGESTESVTRRILETAREYVIECEPLSSVDAQAPGIGVPRIVLLGAGPKPVRAAAELGLRTVLVNAPGQYAAETARLCEHILHVELTATDDILAAVRELHGRYPVSKVISLREEGVLTAARLNEELGLGGNSVETVRALKDKARLRELLDRAGLEPVRYRVVNGPDELAAFQEEIGGPVVLKPLDGVGSDGVTRIEGPGDVSGAWQGAVAAGRATMLAEEFLEGPEISVEALSGPGGHHVVAIADKQVGDGFVEIGHSVPAALDEPGRAAATALTLRVLDAAGIVDGASHTELKLTPAGPRVVESHSRVGGDFIDDLVRLAHGVDFIRDTLGSLAGVTEPAPPSAAARGAAIRFIVPPPGTVTAVEAPDRGAWPAGVELALKAVPGDVVPPLRRSGDRICGYVKAEAATPREAVELCERILEQVRITIQPESA